MRTTFGCFVTLVFAASNSAQTPVTYFVNPVAGLDTNIGTERAKAFKTLSFAATRMGNSDRVILAAGTYAPSKNGETYPIQFGDTSKFSTQNDIEIIGEAGPGATIFDGEQGMTGAGMPMFRFRWDADRASIRGITFTNTGSSDYWSMVFRLGSTSGANFATRNIEITGCVFEKVHRAVVIFGSNSGNQTDGIRFHDNLIVDGSHRGIAVWGPGTNHVYNNTFVANAQNGIWVDSLSGQATSAAVVTNNIINGSATTGIEAGAQGGVAKFENNNSFGNTTAAYGGFTPSATNTTVDPQFVNPTTGNYRLKSTSPMVESGTAVGLPIIAGDLERCSRLYDANNDGQAGIDRGCYATNEVAMKFGGDWSVGKTGTLVFTSTTPAPVAVIFGEAEGALVLLPFGVLLIDPSMILPVSVTTASPTTLSFPIPNNPTLNGYTFVAQGLVVAPRIKLLNGDSRTF